MTRPKVDLDKVDIVADDLACSWRTLRLVRFLRAVGVGAGMITATPGAGVMVAFVLTGREVAVSSTGPAPRQARVSGTRGGSGGQGVGG
jgi:hypothetical protein